MNTEKMTCRQAIGKLYDMADQVVTKHDNEMRRIADAIESEVRRLELHGADDMRLRLEHLIRAIGSSNVGFPYALDKSYDAAMIRAEWLVKRVEFLEKQFRNPTARFEA